MATQSLAMGEAFGKSFQYGKRKISSMSNEEFNKYTISDMMNEQTADIRTLIPKLTEQMQVSQQMQTQIFAEMIKLVPAFINSIQLALTGNVGTTDSSGNITNILPSAYGEEATPPPPGSNYVLDENAQYYLDQNAGQQETTISNNNVGTSNYTLSQLRAMSNSQLQYKIDNELQGTAKSVAQGIINDRPSDLDATGELEAPLTDTITEAQAFTIWQAELIKQQRNFLRFKTQYLIDPERYRSTYNLMKSAQSAIRTISQDYRNPNNGIRTAVLELRQQLLTNRWKYTDPNF